ncbi:AmmeMemoRadiSam system protein B [Candidatus Sumerlaeota bacterium]|nr:AmmeMemoRadiSam system protein B [Candidatus Sumerlaeota bacterium]
MAKNVRPCSGAGFWFPASPAELKREVQQYLNLAPKSSLPGTVVGIISPHAGYRYCGEVMGTVYNTVRGKKYKRVIILAISHSYPISGLSVLKVDAYETPLGEIPVDKEMRDALLKHPLFQTVAPAHTREHSDENQLPFLQTVLEPGWQMVSILVGDISPAEYDTAASLIRPFVDDQTLIVASSDFTHYGFQYGYVPFTKNVKENLYKLDGGAIDKIIAKDFTGFRSYLKETGATICGKNPISLMLKVLPEDATGKLLKYMTSGDVTGDYDMAVGYAGVVFYKPVAQQKEQQQKKSQEKKTEKKPEQIKQQPEQEHHKVIEPEENKLTAPERITLLRLSRDALQSFLETGKFTPDLKKYSITPALERKSGVFVTLTKNGRLRGCIGYVEGIKPLWQAVIDNTRNAAFEDPRFPPVKMKEFDDITIEISVMTPLRQIKSVDEIVVGKHGLVIEKGFQRGLLLPQVPVEWGWDRDEFLVHICQKAGLPPDAWKDPDSKLFVFSAQVFNENDFPELRKK